MCLVLGWILLTQVISAFATPPLHEALGRDDVDQFKQLLDQGKMDFSEQDEFERTIFHRMALNKKIKFMKLVFKYANKKHLNLSGILDYQDKFGQSALHHAVRSHNRSMVEMLLKLGAFVDIVDEEGMTPLHVAAIKELKETAKLLLVYGANPHLLSYELSDEEIDEEPGTPADLAPRRWGNLMHRPRNQILAQTPRCDRRGFIKALEKFTEEEKAEFCFLKVRKKDEQKQVRDSFLKHLKSRELGVGPSHLIFVNRQSDDLCKPLFVPEPQPEPEAELDSKKRSASTDKVEKSTSEEPSSKKQKK